MAVASDRVRATAIEANEFPDLSRAYRVAAVPKIAINDRVEFEGALPEAQFLAAVLEAAAGRAARPHPRRARQDLASPRGSARATRCCSPTEPSRAGWSGIDSSRPAPH